MKAETVGEYLTFAKHLAREAGEIMIYYFSKDLEREWKEDHSPVTIADITINQHVIDQVRTRFPEHSILSEEGSFQSGNGSLTWVCDPLDGTAPFSAGIAISHFSLALIDTKGRPLLGVVFDPFQNRMYSAVKGNGAYLNQQRLRVSTNSTFRNGYIALESRKFLHLGRELQNSHTRVFDLNCVTASGTRLAAGEFDGILYAGNSPWDIAALAVLVTEAGGKVTDLAGSDQGYGSPLNGAILSNSLLHTQLLDLTC